MRATDIAISRNTNYGRRTADEQFWVYQDDPACKLQRELERSIRHRKKKLSKVDKFLRRTFRER